MITPSSAIFNGLIKRYKIKNLPALIVSGDIGDKRVLRIWKSLNGQKDSGNIVIQNLTPFYDLTQQKTRGIVEAIVLEDKACGQCFKGDKYLQAIKRMGMVVGNSAIYDVNTLKGRALVRKYAVIKVPTLILSPDAADYRWFINSWKSVGTKEKNGWFVFRETQKMGRDEKI